MSTSVADIRAAGSVARSLDTAGKPPEILDVRSRAEPPGHQNFRTSETSLERIRNVEPPTRGAVSLPFVGKRSTRATHRVVLVSRAMPKPETQAPTPDRASNSKNSLEGPRRNPRWPTRPRTRSSSTILAPGKIVHGCPRARARHRRRRARLADVSRKARGAHAWTRCQPRVERSRGRVPRDTARHSAPTTARYARCVEASRALAHRAAPGRRRGSVCRPGAAPGGRTVAVQAAPARIAGRGSPCAAAPLRRRSSGAGAVRGPLSCNHDQRLFVRRARESPRIPLP